MKSLWLMLALSCGPLAGCAHAAPPEGDTVILVHGFGRSNVAMWALSDRLEEAGFTVHRVGYSSLTQDMEGIEQEVAEKISCLELDRHRRVHFVGHSLGGLLIRSHLARHALPNLGHVVTLGSPNKGTPVVDHLKEEWWFGLAGPAVHALSAAGSPFLAGLPMPNYPLGVIAGNVEREEYEHILQGQDDGLVPLESTKVEGMRDFLVVPTSHTRLRNHPASVRATIRFLRLGRF